MIEIFDLLHILLSNPPQPNTSSSGWAAIIRMERLIKLINF